MAETRSADDGHSSDVQREGVVSSPESDLNGDDHASPINTIPKKRAHLAAFPDDTSEIDSDDCTQSGRAAVKRYARSITCASRGSELSPGDESLNAWGNDAWGSLNLMSTATGSSSDVIGHNIQDVAASTILKSTPTDRMLDFREAKIQTASHHLPDGSIEVQASSSGVVRQRGKTFKRFRVHGKARVHAGDSITTINNYPATRTVADPQGTSRAEINEQSMKVLLTAMILFTTVLETTVQFFVLLQRAISICPLPRQISNQSAVFEDALGRFQTIDLGFIDSWAIFGQRLERDFHDRPGARRIRGMGYRLFDRVRNNYLVDPRHPPAFSCMFKQGRHVQMSIHFEWDEVSDEQCPRCGLSQESRVDAETICARCRFSYRGEVDGPRVEEVMDDLMPFSPDDRVPSSPSHTTQERDEPAHFNRITISKQPTSIIRSFDDPSPSPQSESREWNARLANQINWQAGRATSAAPFYFEKTISDESTFKDGALPFTNEQSREEQPLRPRARTPLGARRRSPSASRYAQREAEAEAAEEEAYQPESKEHLHRLQDSMEEKFEGLADMVRVAGSNSKVRDWYPQSPGLSSSSRPPRDDFWWSPNGSSGDRRNNTPGTSPDRASQRENTRLHTSIGNNLGYLEPAAEGQ